MVGECTRCCSERTCMRGSVRSRLQPPHFTGESGGGGIACSGCCWKKDCTIFLCIRCQSLYFSISFKCAFSRRNASASFFCTVFSPPTPASSESVSSAVAINSLLFDCARAGREGGGIGKVSLRLQSTRSCSLARMRKYCENERQEEQRDDDAADVLMLMLMMVAVMRTT